MTVQSGAVQSVLLLNDFCHVQGGASRVAIDEAVALRALGLDVTFLGASGPVCEALRDAGVRTVCLGQPELAQVGRHPLVAFQTLWNRRAYRVTRSLLDGMDPRRTVVHLHGYTKALTATPALAASAAGFPVVCTLHDFFAACPNGAFFDYRRQEPCQLRALSAECVRTNCDKRHGMHKAWRVARGFAQRDFQHFPASVRDYITLSAHSAAILRPYLPPDARFHALANIIDIECADPVDVGSNSALMVVGRLDPEKGVTLALEAAQKAGVPIVCIGDGPLRQEVEAAGFAATGWLPVDAVRHALDWARGLVFPSLWYETYGLVVSEAAARGVPAIVSDISAPAERVIDGRTGWIFPHGDADALAGRMALTRDTDVVRAAGAAAWREYWANPSDPHRHVLELTAIYDAVISRRDLS
jgi:glycosyltransferase involved in cell wall biosynthesis